MGYFPSILEREKIIIKNLQGGKEAPAQCQIKQVKKKSTPTRGLSFSMREASRYVNGKQVLQKFLSHGKKRREGKVIGGGTVHLGENRASINNSETRTMFSSTYNTQEEKENC